MEVVKKDWKYYLKSSVFTFLTVALPIFAVDLKGLNFADLETIGFYGMAAVVFRLILKAAWYGIVSLTVWWADKMTHNEE